MDAFDADVLIYASLEGHPLGERIRRLFTPDAVAVQPVQAGVGSVLLVPEVLSKPQREHADEEVVALTELLARIDLIPVDAEIAEFATSLGARYRLRAPDAVHLATAVAVGADRFITNNTRDFSSNMTEIDIVTPADLP